MQTYREFVNLDADCAQRVAQSLAFNKAVDLKDEMSEMQQSLESLFNQKLMISEIMNNVSATYASRANSIFKESFQHAEEVMNLRISILKQRLLSKRNYITLQSD